MLGKEADIRASKATIICKDIAEIRKEEVYDALKREFGLIRLLREAYGGTQYVSCRESRNRLGYVSAWEQVALK